MTSGRVAVGFVGAGRIGEPMVEQLLAAGHPVLVFARRPEVRDRLSAAGAELVDRASAVAAAEIVVSCLYSDAQVLEVLPEVVRAAAPGTVLVSHTTGSPAALDRLAASAGDTSLVEAPFSGTAESVRARALTVYLGGEPAAVAAARTVVETYAAPIVETGARGTALRVKLLNNLLFAAISQVTLRAVRAGADMGVAPEALLGALAVSSGGSTAARFVVDRGGPENFAARVTPFLRKDVAACVQTGAEVGVDLGALLTAALAGPLDLDPGAGSVAAG